MLQSILTFFFSVVFTVIVSHNACAGDEPIQAQVNITAPRGVTLTYYKSDNGKKAYLGECKWIKDETERKSRGYFKTFPLKHGEWTGCSFSFSVDKPAEIGLEFCANWSMNKKANKLNKVWVFYDNITAEGAELINGDFEEESNGRPKFWYFQNAESYITKGTEENKPVSGSAMVRTWYARPAKQIIKVHPEKKVTITFFVKPDKIEYAE